MGSGAITVREEGSDTALEDRYSEESVASLEVIAASRCAKTAGDVTILPATGLADESQTTAQSNQREVALHEYWFALSRQEQVQFGGHFSRILLRAAQRPSSSSPCQPELIDDSEQ